MVAAFAAATFFFSGVPRAGAAGEADAFTSQPQPQSRPSRPSHGSGFFSGKSSSGKPSSGKSSSGKSSNDGSGPGKPDDNGSDGDGYDDNGMPQYPKTESVQDTQKRLDNIDEQIYRLEKVSDSDSETEEDECRLESKAGFNELPDSKNFLYDMDQGRGLKNQAKKVWKNPKAKEEVLRMLNRFDDENSSIQEKPLKGFKNLTELKNSGPGPRIIIHRGKNEPPTVIGFCMRNDLDATLAKLKGKYT